MLGIDPLFGSFHRKCIVNVPILELSVLPKLQIISNHRCFSFDENYQNRRNYNLVTLKKHTTNWCNFPYHKTFYESTKNMDIETNELVKISVNLSIHSAHWWPALLSQSGIVSCVIYSEKDIPIFCYIEYVGDIGSILA